MITISLAYRVLVFGDGALRGTRKLLPEAVPNLCEVQDLNDIQLC